MRISDWSSDVCSSDLIEIPSAVLVLAEVVILFSGIFARYVLNTPLIWSDELASLLFLWLAMLGAAVAFRRAEHMRMTALVNKASPTTKAFLEVFAVSVSLRSEEHTSELQSLMRISYAVFCLTKNIK